MINANFVGVKARGKNVVDILSLVIRKELRQEYELNLSEIYAILDYSDYVDALESEVTALKVENAKLRECEHKLVRMIGMDGAWYECSKCGRSVGDNIPKIKQENTKLREALEKISKVNVNACALIARDALSANKGGGEK